MKKDSTMTIGCDLGDKTSEIAVLDELGELIERGKVKTSMPAFQKAFSKRPSSTIVIEVGTHSRWVSELLGKLGHDVIVANARQVHLIFAGKSKSDAADAEILARLGRVDPKLLAPIQHRGVDRQYDLAIIRARDVAVRSRTQLLTFSMAKGSILRP